MSSGSSAAGDPIAVTFRTPPDITVRPAHEHEIEEVITLLDAALLEVDRESIRRRAGSPSILVAVGRGSPSGAIVLEGAHVEAIAVRRRERRRGIGTALIDAAAADRGRLTATCDERLRPFYASLGFTFSSQPGGRLFGRGPTELEERVE